MNRTVYYDVYPWLEACFNHPSIPIEGIFRHGASIAKLSNFKPAVIATSLYEQEIVDKFGTKLEPIIGKKIRIFGQEEKDKEAIWLSLAVDFTCPFLRPDNFHTTVAILHDALALKGEFGELKKELYENGIRKNKVLLSVSDFAVSSLTTFWSESFLPLSTKIGCPVSGPKIGVQRFTGIDSLSVFTLYPRKNFGAVLDFIEANQGLNHVHVGAVRGDDGALLRRALKLPNFRMLGFVSDEVLMSLYASATVLLQPSLEEGFSMPPMEALMYENFTHVLLSSIPVHRELYGKVERVSFLEQDDWKKKMIWAGPKKGKSAAELYKQHSEKAYLQRFEAVITAIS